MQIADLNKRFSEPKNWRWHQYKNGSGMSVRYGSAFPNGSIPDAVVVILPGLSEFGEKYLELANDLLNTNYGVWVIDWPGQGRSDRYLKNPHKRHVVSFDDEVDTLYRLIKDYTKPSAVHPEVGRIPMIMLGHSAGANIGMRFLHKHPEYFMAAAFSAPMLRPALPTWAPDYLRWILSYLLYPFSQSSVPGKYDWTSNGERQKFGSSIFSSDKERDQVHYTYMNNDEALRIGSPTIRWYREAIKSCCFLKKKKTLADIKIPCLLATAGKDEIVDNKAIKRAASLLPHAELLELPEACHEIFMEKDEIRNKFLERFNELIQKNVLSKEDRFEKF